MMNALRTIPVMLEIARDVERYDPETWILNFTYPAGLVTEAVTKYSEAKIVGLCSSVLFPRWRGSCALGVPEEEVDFKYVGLNHLTFAFEFTVQGKPVTDQQFDRIADAASMGALDPTLVKKLRLIPSPYLQYYFHTSSKVKELSEREYTRAEEVLQLEKEVFATIAQDECHAKPEALAERGGRGYSDIAIGLMRSLYMDEGSVMVLNIPNRGAISGLPEYAIEGGGVSDFCLAHPQSGAVCSSRSRGR